MYQSKSDAGRDQGGWQTTRKQKPAGSRGIKSRSAILEGRAPGCTLKMSCKCSTCRPVKFCPCGIELSHRGSGFGTCARCRFTEHARSSGIVCDACGVEGQGKKRFGGSFRLCDGCWSSFEDECVASGHFKEWQKRMKCEHFVQDASWFRSGSAQPVVEVVASPDPEPVEGSFASFADPALECPELEFGDDSSSAEDDSEEVSALLLAEALEAPSSAEWEECEELLASLRAAPAVDLHTGVSFTCDGGASPVTLEERLHFLSLVEGLKTTQPVHVAPKQQSLVERQDSCGCKKVLGNILLCRPHQDEFNVWELGRKLDTLESLVATRDSFVRPPARSFAERFESRRQSWLWLFERGKRRLAERREARLAAATVKPKEPVGSLVPHVFGRSVRLPGAPWRCPRARSSIDPPLRRQYDFWGVKISQLKQRKALEAKLARHFAHRLRVKGERPEYVNPLQVKMQYIELFGSLSSRHVECFNAWWRRNRLCPTNGLRVTTSGKFDVVNDITVSGLHFPSGAHCGRRSRQSVKGKEKIGATREFDLYSDGAKLYKKDYYLDRPRPRPNDKVEHRARQFPSAQTVVSDSGKEEVSDSSSEWSMNSALEWVKKESVREPPTVEESPLPEAKTGNMERFDAQIPLSPFPRSALPLDTSGALERLSSEAERRSPEAVFRERVSSFSSSVESATAANQTILDSIPGTTKGSKFKCNDIARVLRKHIQNSPATIEEIDRTKVFGYAMWFKGRYGCPTTHTTEIDFNRVTKKISVSGLKQGSEPIVGLWWLIDGVRYYHCGLDATDDEIQPKSTNSSFRRLSREVERLSDELVKSRFEISVLSLALSEKSSAPKENVVKYRQPFTAQTYVVSVPGVQWHIGYRVRVAVNNHHIFVRGTDFRRWDDRNPGTLISNQQFDRFWDVPEGLRLTRQGLAKVYMRKAGPKDQYWRHQIAKSMGVKHLEAHRYFTSFKMDINRPDMEPDTESDCIPDVREDKVTVEYIPVYPLSSVNGPASTSAETFESISLQSPEAETNKGKAKEGPVEEQLFEPAPVDTGLKIKIPAGTQEHFNGSEWLTRLGNEGKSNRSWFRSRYPTDWQYRVSRDALNMMNVDMSKEPGYYSKQFQEKLLIDNPGKNYLLPTTNERASAPPSTQTPTSGKMGQFSFDGISAMANKLRKTTTIVKDRAVHGKVVDIPPKTHTNARDSTQADIEENPGPFGLRESFPDPGRCSFDISLIPDASQIEHKPGQRNDAVVNGREIVGLRHKSQSYGLRSVMNPMCHGLPADTFEKLCGVHTNNLVKECFNNARLSALAWLRKFNIESFMVTAHCEDLATSIPVLDLRTGPHFYANEISEKKLEVFMPLSGMSLRGLRTAFLALPSGFSIFLANGRKADWEALKVEPLESQIPLPKARSGYMDPVYGGCAWYPSGFLEPMELRAIINGSTVYGIDELILARKPLNVVLVKPSFGFRPYVCCATGQNFPCNTTYYNQAYDRIGHLSRFSLDTIGSVADQWYSGRKPCRPTGNGQRKRPVAELWADAIYRAERRVAEKWKAGEFPNMVPAMEGEDDWLANGTHPPTDEGWCFATGMPVAIGPFKTVTGIELTGCECCFRSYQTNYRVWYFIVNVFWYYYSFFFPEFTEDQELATFSDAEYPDDFEDWDDGKQMLCIPTLGTHGDHAPLRYYVNLASHYGVRTHNYQVHVATTAELEGLKRGEMWQLLPGFANLHHVGLLGYRSVFGPHTDIIGQGSTYSLAPPPDYIHPLKYIQNPDQTPWYNYIGAWSAELLYKCFRPTWQIGALRGCDLPRSTHGHRLLKKVENTGKFEVGWLSGSASEEVIPRNIRDTVPRIPNGDHNQLMADYKNIYMHGGAGTVQTAIACGANPIVCDTGLDRNYKRPLTAKDFHQHNVGAFMGWLLNQGFKLQAPFEVQLLWRLQYAWKRKYPLLVETALTAVKCYAIFHFLLENVTVIVLLVLSIPVLLWRLAITDQTKKAGQMTIGFLWSFPLFIVTGPTLVPIFFILFFRRFWDPLLQDLNNLYHNNTSLVYEPVDNEKWKFPFPFGHWMLHDNQTGENFEGVFTTSEYTIGGDFSFRVSRRPLKAGARSFPAPFNVGDARHYTKHSATKPYGAVHNCASMVTEVLSHRSLIWYIFMSIVTFLISLALAPPALLKRVLSRLRPGTRIEEQAWYRSLGFAAGDNGIPLTHPQENMDHKVEQIKTATDNDSFRALIDEINNIRQIAEAVSFGDDESRQEAAERTLDKTLNEIKIPENVMVELGPIPPYKLTTLAQAIDQMHHALSFMSRNELINTFVAWLRGIGDNISQFIEPIYQFLAWALRTAYAHSRAVFRTLFKSVSAFIDAVWGENKSQRVKTVWGLTGIARPSVLSAKARLAASIENAEFTGRHDFERDYGELVAIDKAVGRKCHAKGVNNIGGPQRRKVGWSKPVMSTKEASLLGFKEGEFENPDDIEARALSYLKEGISQGADGVFYGALNPDRIARSIDRYEPRYPLLTSEEKAFAADVAEAMADHNPEVFKNADIMPLQGVHKYIKTKYSPGAPFINDKSFKSRQAMFDAGFDRVLQENAHHNLKAGTYKPQFYHAFVKSQVIPIEKVLPFDEGGSMKDLRTVVSQDLGSYYIDQVVQIERNKRITWDTYGAGIGMPLNQTMEGIYKEIVQARKEKGGRYIIADATAYDSNCKPFLFEVAAKLGEIGFKDHESGNGKAIASVLRAKYDAMQNAWIFGITEPEYDSLTIGAYDHDTRKHIEAMDNKNLVPLAQLIDFKVFDKMNHHEQVKYVQNLETMPGKTLITWHRDLVPRRSHWMGAFEFGDARNAATKFQQSQKFVYDHENHMSMEEDIVAIANSSYGKLSNVHFKNRGGGTGQSATSWDNTATFKAAIIAAWSKTTGQPPASFYEYNKLYNTSDDTIWHSGGLHGLNTVRDIDKFQAACQEYGVLLTIDSTKDISQVEYLSKFVRTPTAEDSSTLKAWRSSKIKTLIETGKIKSSDQGEIDKYNNPQFLVIQDPAAILLRRSGFRYYQGSLSRYRYTSVERGCGHAQVCAFSPALYQKFAVEWIEDVNKLLAEHNIQQQYTLTRDKHGFAQVMQNNPRWKQQSFSPRQLAFLSWLKGNMYPSYMKVINVHMAVREKDPEAHEKFLKKLNRGWRGWNEILREGVDALFDITDAIPDAWSKKFQPGVSMLYAEVPFYSHNKYVESFVYTKCLEEKTVEELTFQDFNRGIQESPYGTICDPYHFWELVQDKQYQDELLQRDPRIYQGMVALITICYALTTPVEFLITGMPLIGIVYKLFLWSFVGLNKVYGIANTLYWHSTGKSSREISRVMPRDPYMWSKRVCCFIVDFIPMWTAYILLPVLAILDLFPEALELVGKIWAKGTVTKQIESKNDKASNPWTRYAAQYISEVRKSPTKRAYIAAKTATGKSTWFTAALWAERAHSKVGKIWLVEPRKILRDQWEIPFDIKSQKLMGGVRRDVHADIYILTYGHFQSRIHEVDESTDLVLFDEFHEEQGEMILGISTYKGPIMLLSATPIEMPELEGTPLLEPDIQQRFKTKVHLLPEQSAADLVLQAEARYPELMDRALVIVPTLKQVTTTIEGLNYLGYKATELSSRQREVPETGMIVATPYVQTGLDIKPPPSILIDTGKDNVIDRGLHVNPLPYTDPDVDKQRSGRVSRLKDGVVIKCGKAGTGKKPVSYPSGNLFMHEAVSRYFKVPALTPISGANMIQLPFMSCNKNVLNTKQIRKSVTAIHALTLSGVRSGDIQKFYTLTLRGKRLGEDYWWYDSIINHETWKTVNLLDWKTAMYHLHRRNAVEYGIAGQRTWTLPVYPVMGQWVHDPEGKLSVEVDNDNTDSYSSTFKQEGRLRNQLDALTKVKAAANDVVNSFFNQTDLRPDAIGSKVLSMLQTV
ncbi:polyprotein [viral metagenome]|uniref:Polyprotein n=1 Tax=viral metagenome TaxID=1070528 RepID=A0A6L2ZL13_9ZZZZ